MNVFSFIHFVPKRKKSKHSNDRELFDLFFPGLVDDIVKENERDNETGEAARHQPLPGELLQPKFFFSGPST